MVIGAGAKGVGLITIAAGADRVGSVVVATRRCRPALRPSATRRGARPFPGSPLATRGAGRDGNSPRTPSGGTSDDPLAKAIMACSTTPPKPTAAGVAAARNWSWRVKGVTRKSWRPIALDRSQNTLDKNCLLI